MKVKLLSILAIGFYSMLSSFALEVTIDNPYQNIELAFETTSYLSVDKTKEVYEKEKWSTNENLDHEEVGKFNTLNISVELKENPILEIYNSLQNLTPTGIKFERKFSLFGKEGKIIYTLNVQLAEEEEKALIESVEIKVLYAEFNDAELIKKSSRTDL